MKIIKFEWIGDTSSLQPLCRMTLEARGLFFFNKIRYSAEGSANTWRWADDETNPDTYSRVVVPEHTKYLSAIYYAQLMSMKAVQQKPYARSGVEHNSVLDTYDVSFKGLSFKQYMELSDLLSVVPLIETDEHLHILGVVGHADDEYRKQKGRRTK